MDHLLCAVGGWSGMELMSSSMIGSRAMTAFTADAEFQKIDAVIGPVQGFRATDMAVQAAHVGGSFKTRRVSDVVPRRQPPALARCVPRDGRLHQKSVNFGEIGA